MLIPCPFSAPQWLHLSTLLRHKQLSPLEAPVFSSFRAAEQCALTLLNHVATAIS